MAAKMRKEDASAAVSYARINCVIKRPAYDQWALSVVLHLREDYKQSK